MNLTDLKDRPNPRGPRNGDDTDDAMLVVDEETLMMLTGNLLRMKLPIFQIFKASVHNRE